MGAPRHFHHHLGELCFGTAKSNEPARANSLLDAFARIVLQRAGTPIGNHDLWIAAHALALGVPLVSNNLRAFERVPGLRLENWV